MNTTPDAPTGAVTADLVLEVAKQELQKYGLEPTTQQTLAEAFRPVFIKAHEAIVAAAGVAESVKDATCVREIKKSRECRLQIKAVRLEGEKVHKAQKEQSLRVGRAVDGFKNILLAEIEPVEEALEAAEKTAERAEAARLAALKAKREAELLPLLDGSPILADLSVMTEQAFVKLLDDHRLLRQAKIDAAAKAEADRLAKEAADRAERDRINLELAKLHAEAKETARLAEIERKRRDAEAAAERATQEAMLKKAEDERRAIEAKSEAERKENAVKLAKERAAAQAELRRLELEREAEEDQRRVEAQKAAAEQARLKAELQARIDADRKAEAAEHARVEAEAKAKAAAERKAAAAPDKSKLEAYLKALPAIPALSDNQLRLACDVARDEFSRTLERYIADLSGDKELI